MVFLCLIGTLFACYSFEYYFDAATGHIIDMMEPAFIHLASWLTLVCLDLQIHLAQGYRERSTSILCKPLHNPSPPLQGSDFEE